jgi:hypothetical protein
LSRKVVVFFMTTGGTHRLAIGPAHTGHCVDASLLVRIEPDCFLEGLWLVCHSRNVAR